MAHSKCERCGSMDRRIYTRRTISMYELQYKVMCPHCLLENETGWDDERKGAWELWENMQESIRRKKEGNV